MLFAALSQDHFQREGYLMTDHEDFTLGGGGDGHIQHWGDGISKMDGQMLAADDKDTFVRARSFMFGREHISCSLIILLTQP